MLVLWVRRSQLAGSKAGRNGVVSVLPSENFEANSDTWRRALVRHVLNHGQRSLPLLACSVLLYSSRENLMVTRHVGVKINIESADNLDYDVARRCSSRQADKLTVWTAMSGAARIRQRYIGILLIYEYLTLGRFGS